MLLLCFKRLWLHYPAIHNTLLTFLTPGSFSINTSHIRSQRGPLSTCEAQTHFTVNDYHLTHTHSRVQSHTSVLLQLMRRVNRGCQPGSLCVLVFVNTPVMAPTEHHTVLSSLLCFSSFRLSATAFFHFSFFRTSFWQMTYVSSWFVRRLSLMTSTPVGRSSWADSMRTKMLSEEHTTQVIKRWCWMIKNA